MGAARIGKISLKAGGAEIVALRRGAPLHSDRRANFINHLGASYDSYTVKYGREPDALVLVLGGLKQDAEAFWTVRGDSEGGATTMLSFAQAVLQREVSR